MKDLKYYCGYKAIITDYLLYEDSVDYHLKLMLTVWNGSELVNEVKYFSYITTWGREQFSDLCVEFGLLIYQNGICCDLNRLLGAYSVVTYYSRKERKPCDNIEEISSAKPYWKNYNFEMAFCGVEISPEYKDRIIPLELLIDEIVEIYYDCMDDETSHPSVRSLYRKNLRELPTPQYSKYDRSRIKIPYTSYPEHNLYAPLTEYDLDRDCEAILYHGAEPLRRANVL